MQSAHIDSRPAINRRPPCLPACLLLQCDWCTNGAPAPSHPARPPTHPARPPTRGVRDTFLGLLHSWARPLTTSCSRGGERGRFACGNRAGSGFTASRAACWAAEPGRGRRQPRPTQQRTRTPHLLAEAIPAVKTKLLAVGQHPGRARCGRGKQGRQRAYQLLPVLALGVVTLAHCGRADLHPALPTWPALPQHSTAQHSTAQLSTAQHGSARLSTAQHSEADPPSPRMGLSDRPLASARSSSSALPK